MADLKENNEVEMKEIAIDNGTGKEVCTNNTSSESTDVNSQGLSEEPILEKSNDFAEFGLVLDMDGDTEERPKSPFKPVFYHSSRTVLKEKEPEKVENNNGAKSNFGNACFNCNGNHSLSDCKEKRNHALVRMNRLKFQKSKSASQQYNRRYHTETDNKYDHLKPGVISKELKNALGIAENQAAPFIYRMRVLGYPPGWLKAAEVHRANISIIDTSGSAMAHPEDEEGEVDSSVKYEPDKLVAFPGFNVPFDGHIEEEGYKYNCPQMLQHHSINVFKRVMEENRAAKYKKRKLNIGEVSSASVDANASTDMDTEDFSEIPPKTQFVDSSNNSPEEGEIDSDEKASSKEDKLSSENDSSSLPSTLDTTPSQQTNNSDSGFVSTNKEASKTESNMDGSNNDTCGSIAKSCLSLESPIVHKSNRGSLSKGFNLGIGVPSTSTPNKSLPSSDQWSVDISDHIDFDNIPNSTGSWDRIHKLMGKVKKTMTQLHGDI